MGVVSSGREVSHARALVSFGLACAGRAWLRGGIFEEGRRQEVEKGTPQGGSISPVLANIYLHYVVDLWFERKIKPQFGGKAALVRYALHFPRFRWLI